MNGSVGNGLSISGIGVGGTQAKIEQRGNPNGPIGGSNPIGDFALELTDDGQFGGQNSLTLTFDQPLAYLYFYMIDAAGHSVTAGSQTFQTNATGSSGDTPRFNGITFAPTDNVTQVTWAYDSGGAAGWAIDDIGYGFKAVVPVPAALPLFASGIAGFAALRRFRRKA